MTAWGTSELRVEVVACKKQACGCGKPCYNRVRLEAPSTNCQAKNSVIPDPQDNWRVVGHEADQAQTLLENRRRGAPGGSFSFGHPLLGKPRPHPPAPHRQQVPLVHRRRREAAQARALSAPSARVE